ncbi:AraC family transcriptional regulator [Amycolatopsis rhabdoformis]|uniref:AraC family transcriptional regulator n=1 Tax=Amycolatopsis rhabdoformis TaxID=1448059 RepID=A0ABZ1ICY4_9PSEU|nr:AraC family transcriptional regulator [Amycolatopsis rhabdoformis]WSE32326.1 AraC family transcriptional regulator [Amycolatopsis rhabdoformis]
MSSAALLERYSVLHASDADAFRVSLSNALTPHRLTLHGLRGVVTADVAVAALGPLSLVYGQHRGAELGVALTEQVDYYDINLSWGGHNRITFGSDEVVVDRTTAGVISPSMRVRMRLSAEYRQLHVRIERAALEARLEEQLGRPVTSPLTFRPAMDLRAPAAASWARAVALLVDDLGTGAGLAVRTLGDNPWSAFLMSGLLLAQPHNYSDRLAGRRGETRRPGPLRRAVELIETRPDGDLSLERLARHAGVSSRSLQRHFHDHVGVSPRDYVRRTRLARVREELAAAGPGSDVTVTEVALRWGFTHVPRFASAYQRRFGELPSTTLRTFPDRARTTTPDPQEQR